MTNDNNLKKALNNAGRTQKWLQEKMEWSQKHTSLLTNCKANTTMENWKKIAVLLECTIDDLVNTDID